MSEGSESFEQALRQLEEVVGRLEKGELELEASLELYEEGIRLSRACHAKLEEAEGRIEMLVKDGRGEAAQDATGEVRTQPVPAAATSESAPGGRRARHRPSDHDDEPV